MQCAVYFPIILSTMPPHDASETAPVVDAVLRQVNNASCATAQGSIANKNIKSSMFHAKCALMVWHEVCGPIEKYVTHLLTRLRYLVQSAECIIFVEDRWWSISPACPWLKLRSTHQHPWWLFQIDCYHLETRHLSVYLYRLIYLSRLGIRSSVVFFVFNLFQINLFFLLMSR